MTEKPRILAIDQGTTSSRAIVFNADGHIVATAQQEFRQSFPADGWVEHDPEEIWQSTSEVCREAIHAAGDTFALAGIGITNQRETTVIWDRASGEPIYPAIVWQDRRTSAVCRRLRDQGQEEMVSERTGLLLDPYFSATKVAWILDHVEDARERAERGELAFGTIDSWLIWKLTDGAVHATDATNASRTMLFNIHEQRWDSDLLQLFGVPEALLPEVKDSAADFGTAVRGIGGRELPIAGVAGDQQAALVGQACFTPGMVKSTYGTGCFALMNTGEQAVRSRNRLLTTVGYRINGRTTYAVEGSIFVAGAAVQWLRDKLGIVRSAAETEGLAAGLESNRGVYLVPAFTGLGAPYWDPDARGALIGLTRDTGRAEIARAALEAVCYQTRDLFEAMADDAGERPAALRVDGGMVVNGWLVQALADIVDVSVERPAVVETTALGAARLAGLQLGLFSRLDDVADAWRRDVACEPAMDPRDRERALRGWRAAVERVRSERGNG
ncbi:glycerol kinase [Natronocella acetinitrilica]|uniref:Glycerol kinase n=1 Tax=Natronocella acetinitrilica TaxID=414046 RepID=A0AAE3G011_9GAMM|nr:glycerol kinase GlpK [Natronocella acetinitrilica]MCP1673075.1 glycerol kinase [Natronocella acetinitrilica]